MLKVGYLENPITIRTIMLNEHCDNCDNNIIIILQNQPVFIMLLKVLMTCIWIKKEYYKIVNAGQVKAIF